MNKSNLYIASILVLLLTGLIYSCRNTTQSSTQIVYDSIIVKKHIPLLELNDTTLPYADVNVNFTFPVKFGNKENLSHLQKIFVGTFFNNIYLDTLTPENALNQYIEDYTKEYKSLSNDYYAEKSKLPADNTPMWYWYYMNLSNKVMFQNKSLLCSAVEYSDYTGGAHGSYMITYANIDLDELVTLSEEDIFVPGYQKPLADKLVNRLMIQNNVSSHESLIEIGFFNIEDIYPNNNFWLDDKGIHYSFNQYEIAPYVMGVIDVFIPYEELGDLLKADVIEKYFGE